MIQKTFNIINKPEIFLVGYKWTGTFEEAREGGIHPIISKMKNNMKFIEDMKESTILYSVNYHDIPNGFTHYSAVQVTQTSDIPSDMVTLHLPSQTYAQYHYKMGDNIEDTYEMIEKTIKENGYKPISEKDMEKNSALPIKIELYPLTDEMNGFGIWIPVKKCI